MEFSVASVNPQVPGSSPGRGANIHAGFGGFCGFILFRNCFAIVPQKVHRSARRDPVGPKAPSELVPCGLLRLISEPDFT